MARSVSPFRIRRVPRRILTSLKATYQRFIFWRALKRFMKDPSACEQAGNRVLANLVHGWGNDWSALEEYLAACIHHALTTTGPILECGSGLSTILVGAIAKERGNSHWALEHLPLWAAKTQGYLSRYELDCVTMCSQPLWDYGEFSWYNPPLESMPDTFSLVLCDGPPASTKGGRYGLVPIMKKRLAPGCVILLDDAGREHELAIAKRWEVELGAHFEVFGSKKPYIELTVASR